MVTDNLTRLKVYLCDKPAGGAVGKGPQVMAYPWLGDGTTPAGKIIGIDADQNGAVDLFLGSSPDVLDRFLNSPINAKLWGKPTAISRSQLTALTSHCKEWTKEPLPNWIVGGLFVTGVAVFMAGIAKVNVEIFALGMVLILGSFFYLINSDHWYSEQQY